MIRLALTLSALLILAAFSPSSAEQASCSDRTEVLKQLSERYSEAPVAMGIANNGGVLEILVSQKSYSWTIIVTMPTGIACVVASGESWEVLPTINAAAPAA